jgi:hypothetical protein
MAYVPTIGTLYPKNHEGYPKPQQPGGIGTQVTQPIQPSNTVYQPFTPATNPIPVNERSAFFFAGCGHCFRSWEVIQDSVNGAPAALLCCPLCNYVQAIYQPPSVILDTNITPQIYG